MTQQAPTQEAKPFKVTPGYQTWLLLMLVLINTCNFVDRTLLGVLAPAIKKELLLTDTQIGMLGGLMFAIFYTTLGLPIARFAERNSRVKLMAVCVAIWSVMTAVCGLAQNFAQLALARVGVGIGEAACAPGSQSLISDTFPLSRRTTALAVYSLGIPFGSLIGAISGGWIAQHMHWRTAFFIVGLPGVLLALLTLTLKEPPRGKREAEGKPVEVPPLSAVVKTLLRKKSVLWVLLGGSVGAAATYGILTFSAIFFVRRFGLDYAKAGLMTGLVTSLPMVVSNLGGGILADWFARKDGRGYAWASVIGMVIAAPLFLVGFMQGNLPAAVTFLVLAGIFQQSYLAPTYAIANTAVEPRMRATSVAVFSFSWNLVGLGFGPMVVGALSDHYDAALAASRSADLLGLCAAGTGAGCADAESVGLAYALMTIALCYGLGAFCYFMSAKTMREDLVQTDEAPATA